MHERGVGEEAAIYRANVACMEPHPTHLTSTRMPTDLNEDITPLPQVRTSSEGQTNQYDRNEKDEKIEIAHIDHADADADDEATIRGTGDGKPYYTAADAKNSVGLALIDQVNAIPSAGDRKVTTKKEYWSYILFGASFIFPQSSRTDKISHRRPWYWSV